jgi:DNA modification methylase
VSCERKIGPYQCCSVVQGDCLELMKLLPDGCVDACITDPPYGISFRGSGDSSHRWKVGGNLVGDGDAEVGKSALAMMSRVPVIAFSRPENPWPGDWSQHLVWDKGLGVGGGGDVNRTFKRTWELIQVSRLRRVNGRDGSVLLFPVEQGRYEDHPTQKPIELMEYLLLKVTAGGELVVDPFCGSGSTLVAAKKLGRHFLGFEIDKTYCEIARKRIALVEAQPTLFEPKPEQTELEL